jgi:hypothetical protein
MGHGYQEIETIGRAGGEISSRIEDKHQYGWLIKNRIIRHTPSSGFHHTIQTTNQTNSLLVELQFRHVKFLRPATLPNDKMGIPAYRQAGLPLPLNNTYFLDNDGFDI